MGHRRRIKLTRPLAIIDLETTGISPQIDRIVEIGALRVMPDGSKTNYHTLVNPEIPIPIEATRVHQIKDSDVRKKPRFRGIAKQVARFLKGCDLAGFNLSRFDLPLLKKEFERAGVPFQGEGRHVVDAQTIFHMKEPRDLKAALKFYCGAAHKKAHSALDDARATWEVLKGQVQRYDDLPNATDAMADFCFQESKYLDLGRWFETRHGEPAFAKGKQHRGKLLSEVAREDPSYLHWMLRLSDLPEDTSQIVRKALDNNS